MPVRIIELLLKERRITPDQLQEAVMLQREHGGRLGAHLVKLGYVKDEEITALLSKQYGVPSIALNQFEIAPGVIKLVSGETARRYQIVPLNRAGATLTIAMTDPTNVFALDDVKFMTGDQIEPVVASEGAVLDAIDRYYGDGPVVANPPIFQPAGRHALDVATRVLDEMPVLADAGGVEVIDDLEEISAETLARQGEEAPVIKLVNVVLMSAISRGASDIHIEPYEKDYRIRYRVDGILYHVMSPPMKLRRRHYVAHQDHGEARHRRKATAAGWPHQDSILGQRHAARHRLSRFRACRRCSARRLSCGCSTGRS